MLCFLSLYPTHASGSRLILQEVSDCQAPRHVVLVMFPRCSHLSCWPAMLACAPLTCLLCFLSPYPTHASGSLHDSAAGEQLACCLRCVECHMPSLLKCVLMAGMLACASLTTLRCFLPPYPTHASGSIMILQQVSELFAARHAVFVMCHSLPRLVCCWLPTLACVPLTSLHYFPVRQPHTCIWISLDSAGSE